MASHDSDQTRQLLAEQINRLGQELGLNHRMIIALLLTVLDRKIPIEDVEEACDRVVGACVPPDPLPWSSTGNPRCVIAAKRH